jgi:hypothetical protein
MRRRFRVWSSLCLERTDVNSETEMFGTSMPWQCRSSNTLPILRSPLPQILSNIRRLVGKYPTKWVNLARKRGTLPRVLDTGTNFSRKAAPHLASFIDVLYMSALQLLTSHKRRVGQARQAVPKAQ